MVVTLTTNNGLRNHTHQETQTAKARIMIMTFHVQLHDAQSRLPSHLHEYLQIGDYGLTLNHPFCFIHGFDMPRRLNAGDIVEQVNSRYARFQGFCAEGDWESAIFSVERPYRPRFLTQMIESYGISPLYSVISAVWTDTETVHDDWETWVYIWTEVEAAKGSDGSHELMTEDEGRFFAKLPSRFVVYRGFNVEEGECGWSWTLDRTKAEWFARRLADADAQPRVATMKIRKAHALAYFAGRNEAEIVVNVETAPIDSAKIKTLPKASAKAA